MSDDELGRMGADLVELAGEFVARRLPRFGAELRRERHNGPSTPRMSALRLIEHGAPIVSGVRPQHALNHFADHRKAERIGAASATVDRFHEFRLRQQALAERPRARVGVVVDVALHEIGGLLVDKGRELRNFADRRLAAEETKERH